MKTLRGMFTAISLLAVVANPVVAMAMPCCCAKPVVQDRTCCDSAVAQHPSGDQQLCCANAQIPRSQSLPKQASCCCVVAPPPFIATRMQFESSVFEIQSLDVAFSAADCTGVDPTSRYLEHSPGRNSASSPPLLALYCIWLK